MEITYINYFYLIYKSNMILAIMYSAY